MLKATVKDVTKIKSCKTNDPPPTKPMQKRLHIPKNSNLDIPTNGRCH